MVHQHDVAGGIKRIAFFEQTHLHQNFFGALMTALAQKHGVGFFIHPIIALALFCFLAHKHGGHGVHHLIKLHVVIGLAGNNQRRACFVDQNRIHFIHHGKCECALHFVVLVGYHIVAQIIKAKFVVGAIRDVGIVGALAEKRLHLAHNHTHAEAEKIIEWLHNARIAPGQIIVYRYHMHAFADQRIEIHRQRGHQRFALAGAHFGDFALMQHHTANQLHIKMAHTQHTAAGFAAHGKSLFEHALERGAIGQALFEFCGFGLQRFIAERLDLGFASIDFSDGFTILFEQTVVAAAKNFLG